MPSGVKRIVSEVIFQPNLILTTRGHEKLKSRLGKKKNGAKIVFCGRRDKRTRLVVMMAEFEIPGRQVDVHYVNAGVPCTVEENFEGYLEHGDLSFEELLQAQEFLYQSFQSNSENNAAEASTSSHTDTSAYGQQRDTETRNIEKEEESSEPNQIAAQLASDEALARTMQEMENQFSETSISGTARKESGIGYLRTESFNTLKCRLLDRMTLIQIT
ncbi:hypothetical protein ACLOJK_006164 [Asimina triloba]